MGNKAPEYTFIDHTADLGIKIRGTDLKDLFENAARALMHLMVRGGSRVETKTMKLSVSGEDLADLMVRWLGEVLYLLEVLNNVPEYREVLLFREFSGKQRHHQHGLFPLGVKTKLRFHVRRMRTQEMEGGDFCVFLGKKRHSVPPPRE